MASTDAPSHEDYDLSLDTSTLPPIRQRVAAGIDLLLTYRAGIADPLGQLDVDRLDMRAVPADVFGQLYGSTAAGLGQWDMTWDQAVAVGFLPVDGEEDELTRTWVEQVTLHRIREASAGQQLPRRRTEMAQVA